MAFAESYWFVLHCPSLLCQQLANSKRILRCKDANKCFRAFFLLPISVVKCENPKVENGKKIAGFGPSYTYRDSVMFECDPGYIMRGAETITCEENSIWSPPKPTCEKCKPGETPAFLYVGSVVRVSSLKFEIIMLAENGKLRKPLWSLICGLLF